MARLGKQAELPFPFLCLLVSGGHNLLVLVRGVGDYVQLGSTLDDALGGWLEQVLVMTDDQPWWWLAKTALMHGCLHAACCSGSRRAALRVRHDVDYPHTMPLVHASSPQLQLQ